MYLKAYLFALFLLFSLILFRARFLESMATMHTSHSSSNTSLPWSGWYWKLFSFMYLMKHRLQFANYVWTFTYSIMTGSNWSFSLPVESLFLPRTFDLFLTSLSKSSAFRSAAKLPLFLLLVKRLTNFLDPTNSLAPGYKFNW